MFGLGGSGCRAPRAAGRRRRRRRPATTMPEHGRRRRQRRHSDRRPAPGRLVADSPRWCSRPACRSPIRRRTGRSGWRAPPRVEVIGDIELFCRERAPPRAGRAVRRHHRHQRQVDDHRADRASARVAPATTRRSAAISAPRSCRSSRRATGRVARDRVSSYQIDLAPSLDPSVGILLNVTEDHLDRHGTLAHYAAVKERLVAGVQENGTAIVGVDDNWCQAAADRIERAGKTRRAHLGAPSARRRALCRGRTDHAGGGRRGATAIAQLGGIGSLRGTAQCAERRLRDRRRARARPDAGADPGGLALVPRACAPHGAGRPQGHACCSSTTPRRPTRIPRRRRWPASATSSGSPAASPRPAGYRRLTGFFPRIRKAYLIGEAAAGFAAELEGKVPHVVAGTLDRAVALAARDAEAADVGRAGGAAVARLRVVRPVPQFRGARRRVPRAGAGAAGAGAGADGWNRLVNPPSTIRRSGLSPWTGDLPWFRAPNARRLPPGGGRSTG